MGTNRIVILVGIFIGAFFTIAWWYATSGNRSRADQSATISLSGASAAIDLGTTANFSLYSKDKPLFKGSRKGTELALELIKNRLPISQATGITDQDADLLPANYWEDAIIIDHAKDSDDPFLKKNNIHSDAEHFTFQQVVDGTPVFESTVTLHIKNGTDLYGLTGRTVRNADIRPVKIDEQVAINEAVTDLTRQIVDESQVTIIQLGKLLYSKQLSDGGLDTALYPAVRVLVEASDSADRLLKSQQYIVSLTDGTILKDIKNPEAINRRVRNCFNSLTTAFKDCADARLEGQPATGNELYDVPYDIFGQAYNFYATRFGLDSYDGKGEPIYALSNGHPDVVRSGAVVYLVAGIKEGTKSMVYVTSAFPTLWTTPALRQFALAHEYAHLVIYHTGKLDYTNRQSMALHEGNASVMPAGLTPEDDYSWIDMKLDLPLDMQRRPARVFDERYECGVNADEHNNGQIVESAFYLLAHGTRQHQYNGCKTAGIGKVKALNIWYRAISTYLQASSNFKTQADALIQACRDLYGQTSTECAQTLTAVQATEMDQQPVGLVEGAKCANIAPRQPGCYDPNNIPTIPPNGHPPSATVVGPSMYTIGQPGTTGQFSITVKDLDMDVNPAASSFYAYNSNIADKSAPIPAGSIKIGGVCASTSTTTCETRYSNLFGITMSGTYTLFPVVEDKRGNKCSGNPQMTDGTNGYTVCGTNLQNAGGFVSTIVIGGTAPTVSPSPTPTNTPTTGPSITGVASTTPAQCPKKPQGDANCDNAITVADFNRWRQEYIGTLSTKTADFNGNGTVTVADFNTWRTNYLAK